MANLQAIGTMAGRVIQARNNPVARGHYISIYATGAGPIPGAPADGNVSANLVSTPGPPSILIGTCFVDDDCGNNPADTVPPGKRVQFSGLSPSYPGVWQINVYVPQSVAPSSAAGPTAVDIIYNNSPAWSANSPQRTFI